MIPNLFSFLEYDSPQDIEPLIEKGILDIKLDFLIGEFAGKPDTHEWFNFFEELGVGNVLEEGRSRILIAQRIGVKVALM